MLRTRATSYGGQKSGSKPPFRGWDIAHTKKEAYCHDGGDREELDAALGKVWALDVNTAGFLERRRHCLTNRIAEIIDPKFPTLQKVHCDVFNQFSSLLRYIYYYQRNLRVCAVFPVKKPVSLAQEVFTREERIICHALYFALGFGSFDERSYERLLGTITSINLRLNQSRVSSNANIYERLREYTLYGLGDAFLGLGRIVYSDRELGDLLQIRFSGTDVHKITRELHLARSTVFSQPKEELSILEIELQTIFPGVYIRSAVVFLLHFAAYVRSIRGCTVVEYLAESAACPL